MSKENVFRRKNFVMSAALVGVALVSLISCVSSTKAPGRMVASQKLNEVQNERFEVIAAQGRNYDFSNNNRPKAFESDEIAKISSSANMQLAQGQLLTDNDAAFQKKLDIINEAKSDLRIVYYIYADDGTSSEFNRTLLEKAKRAKVKLLVDFVTNYKNLDLFNMLAAKSNGNIDVRFYNYPSTDMFADATYIAMPCPNNEPKPGEVVQKFECREHKNVLLVDVKKDIAKNIMPANGQLLMSGLFGKNGTALKVALGYLAEIDPAQYKKKMAGDGASKIRARDLVDLAQLFKDALIKNDLFAKIKLSIALATHEAELNPLINELSGRLPTLDSKAGRLWDHFTDYTHHKLLLADKNQFILGGRNIEDSYHMKVLGKKGKYVFMDTDFWGRTKDNNGAADMASSFDKLFNNKMVATLEKVNQEMPNDFIANTAKVEGVPYSPAERAVGACAEKKAKGEVKDFAECLEMILPMVGPNYADKAKRIEMSYENMMATKAQSLVNPKEKDPKLRQYKDYARSRTPSNPFGELSEADLKSARVFYLENTHVKEHEADDSNVSKRIAGSKYGSEIQNGKKIHYAWYRGLENACVKSREIKKTDPNPAPGKTYVQAIFHTAYLFMPAGLVHSIAKMMNNDWGDCSGVEITFISNSEATTDLGPINILARYQTVALFSHYYNLETYAEKHKQYYVRFFPKLKYFEYSENPEMAESLHTKTTLIGNDLIVGSANADVRSYYMDSNNAVLIRGANNLNRAYEAYINKLKQTSRIVEKQLPWHTLLVDMSKKSSLSEQEYGLYIYGLTQSLTLDHTSINTLNRFLVGRSLERWKQDPKHTDLAVNILQEVGESIMADTFDFVLFREKFNTASQSPDMYNRRVLDEEHNKKMQTFDDRFKLF